MNKVRPYSFADRAAVDEPLEVLVIHRRRHDFQPPAIVRESSAAGVFIGESMVHAPGNAIEQNARFAS